MTFSIKQNDTSPSLQATLTDYSGAAINLTNCVVNFHMKNVNGSLTINSQMTIVSALNGIVQYNWVSGDTNVPGTYYVEFEVTYPNTSIETFPNNNNDTLIIYPSLA